MKNSRLFILKTLTIGLFAASTMLLTYGLVIDTGTQPDYVAYFKKIFLTSNGSPTGTGTISFDGTDGSVSLVNERVKISADIGVPEHNLVTFSGWTSLYAKSGDLHLGGNGALWLLNEEGVNISNAFSPTKPNAGNLNVGGKLSVGNMILNTSGVLFSGTKNEITFQSNTSNNSSINFLKNTFPYTGTMIGFNNIDVPALNVSNINDRNGVGINIGRIQKLGFIDSESLGWNCGPDSLGGDPSSEPGDIKMYGGNIYRCTALPDPVEIISSCEDMGGTDKIDLCGATTGCWYMYGSCEGTMGVPPFSIGGNTSTYRRQIINPWLNDRSFAYIAYTGSMAIGTTNPGIYKLNVQGDLNATRVCINGTCQSTWPVGGGTSSQWITTGSNKIYYNSGNVGIGTNNPTEKLEVAGTGKFTRLCLGASCISTWPGADNLGNHTASQNLNMDYNEIYNATYISANGLYGEEVIATNIGLFLQTGNNSEQVRNDAKDDCYNTINPSYSQILGSCNENTEGKIGYCQYYYNDGVSSDRFASTGFLMACIRKSSVWGYGSPNEGNASYSPEYTRKIIVQ